MFTIEAMVKDSRFLGFKRENPNPLVLGVSAQRQIGAKHNTTATGWLEWGRGFIFSKTDTNCAVSLANSRLSFSREFLRLLWRRGIKIACHCDFETVKIKLRGIFAD